MRVSKAHLAQLFRLYMPFSYARPRRLRDEDRRRQSPKPLVTVARTGIEQ